MTVEQSPPAEAVIAHAMRSVWNEQHPAVDVDVDALMEGMKLTPWERILANDIASNYLDSLKNTGFSHASTLVPACLPN